MITETISAAGIRISTKTYPVAAPTSLVSLDKYDTAFISGANTLFDLHYDPANSVGARMNIVATFWNAKDYTMLSARLGDIDALLANKHSTWTLRIYVHELIASHAFKHIQFVAVSSDGLFISSDVGAMTPLLTMFDSSVNTYICRSAAFVVNPHFLSEDILAISKMKPHLFIAYRAGFNFNSSKPIAFSDPIHEQRVQSMLDTKMTDSAGNAIIEYLHPNLFGSNRSLYNVIPVNYANIGLTLTTTEARDIANDLIVKKTSTRPISAHFKLTKLLGLLDADNTIKSLTPLERSNVSTPGDKFHDVSDTVMKQFVSGPGSNATRQLLSTVSIARRISDRLLEEYQKHKLTFNTNHAGYVLLNTALAPFIVSSRMTISQANNDGLLKYPLPNTFRDISTISKKSAFTFAEVSKLRKFFLSDIQSEANIHYAMIEYAASTADMLVERYDILPLDAQPNQLPLTRKNIENTCAIITKVGLTPDGHGINPWEHYELPWPAKVVFACIPDYMLPTGTYNLAKPGTIYDHKSDCTLTYSTSNDTPIKVVSYAIDAPTLAMDAPSLALEAGTLSNEINKRGRTMRIYYDDNAEKALSVSTWKGAQLVHVSSTTLPAADVMSCASLFVMFDDMVTDYVCRRFGMCEPTAVSMMINRDLDIIDKITISDPTKTPMFYGYNASLYENVTGAQQKLLTHPYHKYTSTAGVALVNPILPYYFGGTNIIKGLNIWDLGLLYQAPKVDAKMIADELLLDLKTLTYSLIGQTHILNWIEIVDAAAVTGSSQVSTDLTDAQNSSMLATALSRIGKYSKELAFLMNSKTEVEFQRMIIDGVAPHSLKDIGRHSSAHLASHNLSVLARKYAGYDLGFVLLNEVSGLYYLPELNATIIPAATPFKPIFSQMYWMHELIGEMYKNNSEMLATWLRLYKLCADTKTTFDKETISSAKMTLNYYRSINKNNDITALMAQYVIDNSLVLTYLPLIVEDYGIHTVVPACVRTAQDVLNVVMLDKDIKAALKAILAGTTLAASGIPVGARAAGFNSTSKAERKAVADAVAKHTGPKLIIPVAKPPPAKYTPHSLPEPAERLVTPVAKSTYTSTPVIYTPTQLNNARIAKTLRTDPNYTDKLKKCIVFLKKEPISNDEEELIKQLNKLLDEKGVVQDIAYDYNPVLRILKLRQEENLLDLS